MPLRIKVKDSEFYDERKNEFFVVKGHELILEHSLISISKWESKWKKPFISTEKKTNAEMQDYIRCMTISKIPDDNIYKMLSSEDYKAIAEYMDDAMTATTFHENEKNVPRSSRQIITSELIYYWMIDYGIPFECQKWHLNRLLTLIRICGIKAGKPEKMGKNAIYEQNRALNELRKAELKTKG